MRQSTRLIVNVLTNYGAFGVYGVANIFLVGYVIRLIGKDAFGIVALAMSLTIVTELLGRGIGQAVTKHVSSDVSRGDFERVNRFVNTSLAWLIGCGVLGAVICGVLAGFIERIVQVPEQLVPAARVAIWLMGLRVLLCFPFNTFQSLLFAYQRYDLTNLARVVTIVLRVVLVIVWFEFVSAGVVELIALTIVSLIVERVMWVVFALRVAPQLRFTASLLSWATLGILAGFGGLMLIIDVANLIGYEAVKWVVGVELSVADVGAYSLLATLAAFAGTMVRSVANVLTPAASRFSALGEREKNSRLALLSTKYALIVAGGLCLAPIALLEPFLLLWVGDSYPRDYIAQIAQAGMVLLAGQWCIATAVCFLQMLTGIGKLWVPAMVTLGWALGGLGGVWAYLHWGGGGLFGAVVGISAARVVGSSVHLVYGVYTVSSNAREFFAWAVVRPGCAAALACAAGAALAALVNAEAIPLFLGSAAAIVVLYGLATWVIVLSPDERSGVVGRLRQLAGRARSADTV